MDTRVGQISVRGSVTAKADDPRPVETLLDQIARRLSGVVVGIDSAISRIEHVYGRAYGASVGLQARPPEGEHEGVAALILHRLGELEHQQDMLHALASAVETIA